jgi:hypothetical protein
MIDEEGRLELLDRIHQGRAEIARQLPELYEEIRQNIANLGEEEAFLSFVITSAQLSRLAPATVSILFAESMFIVAKQGETGA